MDQILLLIPTHLFGLLALQPQLFLLLLLLLMQRLPDALKISVIDVRVVVSCTIPSKGQELHRVLGLLISFVITCRGAGPTPLSPNDALPNRRRSNSAPMHLFTVFHSAMV